MTVPLYPRTQNDILAGVLLAVALVLGACGEKPEQPKQPEQAQTIPEASRLLAVEASFDDLPGWDADRLSDALPALTRSCGLILTQPDERAMGPDGLAGTVADWRGPCRALTEIPDEEEAALRDALRRDFLPFKLAGPESESGLITGYYEAELRGALFPGDVYRFPLFAVPDDLVTVDLGRFRADLARQRLYGRVDNGELVPYYERAEIDAGVLLGRNLEVLWVDDPVDAFFLHVQGSGQVRLPDDSIVRVGFAGSNGLPFFAIGRALIDEGKVSRKHASMQSIRDWLRANTQEATEMMQRNKRYIFFRRIEGDGPIGAQGVALTPGRSLAIDPGFLPLGAPLWLDTTWPGSDKPLRRLMVTQDTGSAIKGPVRGDFFWGSGEAALEQAGRMKQKGEFYLFLPKPVAERRRTSS